MGNVTVRTGRNGSVVTMTRNHGVGYILLEQMVPVQNPRTKFVTEKRRTALMFGSVSMLQGLGWEAGQEVGGRIVLTESFEKSKGMVRKVAGNTGVVCTKDGREIYHKTWYSIDPDEQDETIQHDNGKEIARVAKVFKDFDTSQA